MSDSGASPEAVGGLAAGAAESSGRLSLRARRVLLILSGVLVASGSVAGFYSVAERVDERVAVTVAAVDIPAGRTVAASDLASVLAHPGSIPHFRWFQGSVSGLEGLVAVHDIAAGSLLGPSMFVAPGVVPVGAQLRLRVPVDSGLAGGVVADGDVVLLVDPGAPPAGVDPGRPRRVVRSFEVSGFDGSAMSLFLEPEAWADWRRWLRDAGGVFEVLPVPVGADVEDLAGRVDAVWAAEWAETHAEVLERQVGPGPGELEVRVRLDDSLAPAGLSRGDRVVLVDPGVEPGPQGSGRPRSVLEELVLARYEAGVARLFVPPQQWLWWHGLADSLGAAPMALPVAEGTDVAALASVLDLEWEREWESAVEVCQSGESERCWRWWLLRGRGCSPTRWRCVWRGPGAGAARRWR